MHEVIQPEFLKETDLFPDDFIKKCKDNTNEAQFLPLEVKNDTKQMATEQGLYAQVVKIRRKDLKFTAENKNKNDAKFKFHGQSARSQRWFDLGFDWIEVNISTREPDLYKKLFQSHANTQDTNTLKIFQVPIGNSKCVETFKFHNDAPMLKYCHKLLNICCFSSLASYFSFIKQKKAANAISFRTE